MPDATPCIAHFIRGCQDFKSPVIASVSIVAIAVILSLATLPFIGLGPTTFIILEATVWTSSILVGVPIVLILIKMGITQRETRRTKYLEAQRKREAKNPDDGSMW